MGKDDFTTVCFLLNNIIKCIDTYIITPLTLSTQTICFQLDIEHINLHNAAKHIPQSMYTAELFPALSINVWYPLHVNVFASGKVVVLGKGSLRMKSTIEEWLMLNCK